MLISPSSNVFNILGVQFHYYGIIIALGLCISILFLIFFAKKVEKQIDINNLLDILPLLFLCAVLGARFYYCLLNWNYYSFNILGIFKIWQGGLAIHGAILGGVLLLLFLHFIKKINFLVYTDILACVLPLGQAIGRWGNYFNQEAFGSPCSYFWCLYIEPQFRPYKYLNVDYFHPTFLYESFYDLVLFVILSVLYLKFLKMPSGVLFLCYLILYSLGRFFIELLRIDSQNYILGLPFPAFISLLIFFIALLVLVLLLKKSGKFIF